MQTTEDVRQFYEHTVGTSPEGYEYRRWFSSAARRAGYDMTRKKITRLVIPLLEDGMTVLELGPGAGTWTRILIAARPKIILSLVDISGQMLAQARAAIPPSISVKLYESDFLLFNTNEQFDFFFSSRALEYFPDKEAAVKKIAALLKPGARGFLSTKYPHYRRRELLGEVVPAIHRGQITPEELVAHFELHGLSVERVEPVTFVFPKLHAAFLDRLLFVLFSRFPLNPLSRPFVESYCIVFRKQ